LLSRFGGRNTARGARQQAHADVFFEPPNCMAHRGRRNAMPFGGAGKAAFLGDAEESGQTVEIVAFH